MKNHAPISSPIFIVSEETQEAGVAVAASASASASEEMRMRPSLVEDTENEYVAHLLRLGQSLCMLRERHIEFLCHEVKVMTRQHASLHLNEQAPLAPDTFSTLPIQFNHFLYGYLALARDRKYCQRPAIPLSTGYRMAQAISHVLHTLEQHLFIQSFGKRFPRTTTISLTKRQRDVLSLLCRGCTQEEIAKRLSVSLPTVKTHRQRIYEQLGVHNEYDARIAAYTLGLYSLLRSEE